MDKLYGMADNFLEEAVPKVWSDVLEKRFELEGCY